MAVLSPDRALFDLYSSARAELYDSLFSELETFVRATFDGNAARFALAVEEYLPIIVAEYGDIAGSIALDYFEVSRDLYGITSRHRPILVPAAAGDLGASVGWSTSDVREALKAGLDPDAVPEDVPDAPTPLQATIEKLQGVAHKQVKEADAATFVANVEADREKPVYARVPNAGACGFCRFLASSGFRYYAGVPESIHAKCFCEFVASWDKTNPKLEGFNPESLQEEYRRALAKADKAAVSEFYDHKSPTPRSARNKKFLNALMAGYYEIDNE